MKEDSLAEQHSQKETQKRLRSALRGAFAGPPTQLKNIPKKDGEPRIRKAKKRK